MVTEQTFEEALKIFELCKYDIEKAKDYLDDQTLKMIQEYLKKQDENPVTVAQLLEKIEQFEDRMADKIESMIRGIYLGFPGYSGKKPVAYPYNEDNPIEVAAATAYYSYVKEVHGVREDNVLLIAECVETFNKEFYRKEEIPSIHDTMEQLGETLLHRVEWKPNLWLVEPIKKDAEAILEQFKKLK